MSSTQKKDAATTVATTQKKEEDLKEMSHQEYAVYVFVLLFALYCFLFGLDLMGNAFKALSGKSVSTFFTSINDPIAGVMAGILVTVLLQSSSTTTSIVVTMVGAGIISVEKAIPLIMGANIGTSVTNSITSHGHVVDDEEFTKAFSGATVHDLFNLLTVGTLLPLEVITGAFGAPFLFSISKGIAHAFGGVSGGKFTSPVKAVVGPLTKLFVKIDKDIMKALSTGCQACNYLNTTTNVTTNTSSCWDVKQKNCLTQAEFDKKYTNGRTIKSGALKGMGDIGGGVFMLILSLVILCTALIGLVYCLKKIVLGGARQTRILKAIRYVLELHPVVAMIFGCLLTICVQSSSITTSVFTPLVGLSIITLEEMLTLTLGANIGTTCTAFLASLVTGSTDAVQVALCHLLFNLIGIAIWFPVPAMRNIPLRGARHLGTMVAKFRFFGFFYIMLMFLTLPALLWCVSLMMSTTAGIVFGVFIDIMIFAGAAFLIVNFELIMEKMNIPAREITFEWDEENGDEKKGADVSDSDIPSKVEMV
eukprot:g3506.t1